MTEAPPKPGDVLYMIYQVDGDGASSYPVQNGSIATYWAGHQFTLGGKKYFTGFAYNTPEKYNGNTKVDPSAGVTLTQATFELNDPGTPKPWAFVGSEHWIGDYGIMESGPKFDGLRQVLEYPVGNDVMLLAIPSKEGVPPDSISTFYELFSFRPAKTANVDDRHWNYLGHVQVGDDGTAWCKANSGQPCTKWTGTLKFMGDAHAMPTIRVIPEGTTVDDDTGEARKVNDKEAAVYVFNKGKYGYK